MGNCVSRSKYKAQLAQAKSDLNAVNIEKYRIQENLITVESEIEKLREDNDALLEQNTQYQEAHKRLKRKLRRKSRNVNKYESDADNLRKQNEKLRRDINAISKYVAQITPHESHGKKQTLHIVKGINGTLVPVIMGDGSDDETMYEINVMDNIDLDTKNRVIDRHKEHLQNTSSDKMPDEIPDKMPDKSESELSATESKSSVESDDEKAARSTAPKLPSIKSPREHDIPETSDSGSELAEPAILSDVDLQSDLKETQD